MDKQLFRLIDRLGAQVDDVHRRDTYYIFDLCCVGHARDIAECVNNSIGFSARIRGRFIKIYFTGEWK